MELVNALVGLYNANPECIRNYNQNNWGKKIKDELIKIKEEPPKNLKLKTLDNYALKDSLTSIFGYLPSRKVYENFGEEILFWGAVRSRHQIQEKNSFKDLEEVFNGKEKNIENMRSYYWQTFCEANSEDTYQLWKLYNNMNQDFFDQYDLNSVLKNNLRENCKISDEKLKKYSLTLFRIKDNSIWREKKWYANFVKKREVYGVQMESPTSFGLMKNGEPCAFTSFLPISNNTLLINALQGVNKKYTDELEMNEIKKFPQTGLAPFYWKNVLLEITKDIAKENKFRRIGIQSAENNRWTKPYSEDKKIHLSFEKAVKIYDEFAESIRMQRGKDKNFYIKI